MAKLLLNFHFLQSDYLWRWEMEMGNRRYILIEFDLFL